MDLFLGTAATIAAIIGFLSIVVVGGVVWGIAHAAGWGKSSKRQLAEGKRSRPYAYLDASETTDAASVTKVTDAYVDDAVLGPYAHTIASDFETYEARKKAIMQILDAEFEPHSMTWERFCAPLETAGDTIVGNAAQVANHMQAFDSSAYDHLDRMERAGALEGQETELSRLEIARTSLAEMDALLESNKRLLVEVEHLQSELSQLSGADLTSHTDEIAEEIARLAEEARYYA